MRGGNLAVLLLLLHSITCVTVAARARTEACNFAVDAGTGQGFEKGIIRGGNYFRAVTPATDPVASATAAGCAALCCATDGCLVFSLNAPWSLASGGRGS